MVAGSAAGSVGPDQAHELALNPHLKYVNMRDHGYLLLSLTKEAATGQFFYVQRMLERNAATLDGPAFEVKTGEVQLHELQRERE